MWTWNGWNPFKSKHKDDSGTSSEQSGKENVNGGVEVLDKSGVENERPSSRNGKQKSETHGTPIKTQENDLSLLSSPLRNSSRNRSVVGGQDQFNLNDSRTRPNSNGHNSIHRDSNNAGTVFKSMEENNSPSLSTPIVPQIRRALESKLGLRRPQTPEEEFLHYLSVTRSTAGQLPYVKLKKRDSLTLSDLVDGKIPLSPNTVKLARLEQRHLPPAPRFKSTPVMVTTQASRPSVMDTQTVVSALREKRKRLGPAQQAETLSEDSWQSSAKRRRQDSSQSNASSVSMPSMPEALPNLIGSPGASLLHIENLTDQRPSTVPAVDTFISHQQRSFGLGGPASPAQAQQFYHNPQQQSVASNTNNNKRVLRSLQASLSSSQRHMAQLAMLNQQGIDNKCLRSLSKPSDSPRKVLFSEEIAAAAKSQSESLAVSSEQENVTTVSTLSITTINQTSTQDTVSPSTHATPARREIAKGVYLRTRYSTANPTDKVPQATKISPGNPLASADDFEKDRKREYNRRMLELFGEEDASEAKALHPPSSTTLSLIQPSAPALNLSSSPALTLSSAVTSAAVSASLDSLNKLVQLATSPFQQQPQPTSLATASSANSLSNLLKPNEGNAVDSSSSIKPSLTKPAETTSSSCAVTSDRGLLFTLGAPAKSEGFSFGTPLNEPRDSPPGSGLNTGSNTSAITSKVSSLTTAGLPGFNFSSAPASTAVSGGITFGNPVSKANTTPASAGSEGILSNSATYLPPTVSTSSQGFNFSSNIGSTAPAFNISNKMPDLLSNSGQVGEPNANKESSNAPSVGFIFGTTSSAASSAPVIFGQTASSSLNRGQCISSTAITLGSTTNTASVGSLPFDLGQTTLSTASTAPSFNFGQASGATGTFGSSNTNNVSSSGSALVGFGQPTTSNSNSAPFNFAQAPATTGVSSAPFVVGQTAMATAAPFSFGQTAPTNVSTTSFNFGQTVPTNVSTAPFSFGQGEPSKSTNATPFSFGQPTATTNSTSSLGFGPMGTTNSISSPFSFGQQAAMPKAANTTSLGFSQTAPANKTSTVSFRQVPNLTSGNTANVNFGQVSAISTASASPFNIAQASNNTATKLFGFGVPSTQSSAPSLFGSTPATSMPSTGSLFGSTNAVTSASSSLFGSSNAAQAFGNASSLGSSAGFGSSLSGFNNSSASSLNPSGTSATFSLPAATTTVPAFGSSAAPATAFGSSAAPATAFGSSAATAFGSSAAPATAFGSSAAPATAFGSSAAPATAFGSSAATAFGSSAAPATAFGSSAAPATAFGSNAPSASVFGSNAPSSSVFGSSAAPASTFGNSVGPIFGAPTSKSFSFGTTPASTPSTPVFGVATTSSAFGTSAPSLSIFGAKPATSSSFLGAPATTTASSMFGTSSGTQQPAFGGPPPFGSSQPNPPAFGSHSSANTTGFGTSNPPALFGAPSTQPSFNFTGQSHTVTAFGSQASNTGGLNFAQPAGNSGFNFSAQATPRPSFSALATGGFNFSNQTTPGGAFNFGATPSTPLTANRPRAAARRPARRGGARR